MAEARAEERRYKMLRRVGGGAFGSVYLAEKIGTDQQVAIKVLKPERRDAITRLRDEARISGDGAAPVHRSVG